jgi:hypothetical protein
MLSATSDSATEVRGRAMERLKYNVVTTARTGMPRSNGQVSRP